MPCADGEDDFPGKRLHHRCSHPFGGRGGSRHAQTLATATVSVVFGRQFRRIEAINGGILAVVFLGMALAGCTGEEPVPIDLNETVAPPTEPDDATVPVDPNDPNAGERQRMDDLATEQCLDDPSLSEGVVRLVDPETGEAAAEVVIDCATVR